MSAARSIGQCNFCIAVSTDRHPRLAVAGSDVRAVTAALTATAIVILRKTTSH
jgi:hypothetical protein